MVICSFITTKGIDGLIKLKGMHHGIPFCLKKIVFFKFPFPLITPVLQEAPCAPRYEGGCSRRYPASPPRGGGEEGIVVAEERQRGADRR